MKILYISNSVIPSRIAAINIQDNLKQLLLRL